MPPVHLLFRKRVVSIEIHGNPVSFIFGVYFTHLFLIGFNTWCFIIFASKGCYFTNGYWKTKRETSIVPELLWASQKTLTHAFYRKSTWSHCAFPNFFYQKCIKNTIVHSHTIHVWYIYLHLVDFYGKCWWIYHTWMVWDFTCSNKFPNDFPTIPTSERPALEVQSTHCGSSDCEGSLVMVRRLFPVCSCATKTEKKHMLLGTRGHEW